MKITHKTLAIGSGIALVMVVAINIYAQINESSMYSEYKAEHVRLNKSHQDITVVPQSLFLTEGVEVLDLSHNKLTGALPSEVHKMSHLRELNLSNNTFTGIPAEVGQLSQLEVLNVSNNAITGLPYEIGNLQNLQLFDLRGNKGYSREDLEVIRSALPEETIILVD